MPGSTPTLRDMIQEALDRGQTYEQLEKRAIDPQTNEPVSRSMMNNIVNRKVGRMPYEHHLRAIAAALGAPYEAVRRAAIAQWLPESAAEQDDADTSALLEEARRLAAKVAELTEQAERQMRAEERRSQRESA